MEFCDFNCQVGVDRIGKNGNVAARVSNHEHHDSYPLAITYEQVLLYSEYL